MENVKICENCKHQIKDVLTYCEIAHKIGIIYDFSEMVDYCSQFYPKTLKIRLKRYFELLTYPINFFYGKRNY